LLASAPLAYPPQARSAQVEAGVPLELVVDRRGVVTQARALVASGYGLDDAALRAVRTYRFSPALRDGRPVSVRMRWTVIFRLQ
jgi:protein TonB